MAAPHAIRTLFFVAGWWVCACGGATPPAAPGPAPAATPPAAPVETAPVGLGPAPPIDEQTFVRGRRLYERECWRCHGPVGRGDGPDAAALRGPAGERWHPRDFATLSAFPAGARRVSDLARAIRAGVPGTPMAAHPTLLDAAVWDLARYLDTVIVTAEGLRHAGADLPRDR